MIESILIKGFRGIRSGQIDGFRKFNVFVGPNNSGKSAVIESLYLAGTAGQKAHLVTQPDQQQNTETLPVSISSPDLLGAPPLAQVLGRHNYAGQRSSRWEEGVIKVQVMDKKAPFTGFDIYAGQEHLFAREEEPHIAIFSLDLSGTEDQEIGKLVVKLIGQEAKPFSDKRVIFCWSPELSHFGKGSATWMIKGQPPVARHTLLFDTTVAQGQLSSLFIQEMLGNIPGFTQRIGQHVGAVFNFEPSSFNVQFLPINGGENRLQGWIAPKDRPGLPIDTFGDGMRAAFKLLTPLVALAESATQEEPGLLLWEEPESFQNPKTLANLLKEVAVLIEKRPVQVFFATHSLEFVAHLTLMLQSGQIDPDEVKLFRLNLADGEMKYSWFDSNNMAAWLESGMDPRVWGDFLPPVQFRLQEEHR